ncbi:MAG TPA: Rieske (2Fe-2S) protein [Vicinamibacterales bacterium]
MQPRKEPTRRQRRWSPVSEHSHERRRRSPVISRYADRRGLCIHRRGHGLSCVAVSRSPASGEPATATAVAAKASELKPNTGKIFKFGARPGIVVRTADGELRAFSAVCTHLDCTVQFKADTSQLWCACHNGTYDLGGNVVSGPPPRGLEEFTVNVRGEGEDAEIVVSRRA